MTTGSLTWTWQMWAGVEPGGRSAPDFDDHAGASDGGAEAAGGVDGGADSAQHGDGAGDLDRLRGAHVAGGRVPVWELPRQAAGGEGAQDLEQDPAVFLGGARGTQTVSL